jgi:hypothetical protein
MAFWQGETHRSRAKLRGGAREKSTHCLIQELINSLPSGPGDAAVNKRQGPHAVGVYVPVWETVNGNMAEGIKCCKGN